MRPFASVILTLTNASLGRVVGSNATDAEVGFDIVRRLILDIMGRNTHNAKIFENKTNSEFLSTRIVTHEMKIIVFAGVIIFDLYLISSCIAYGALKGKRW